MAEYGQEQFQLYFHLSLVRHSAITNSFLAVTSPVRIGHLSVAWLSALFEWK